MSNQRIIIIGFMGAGKTTVAHELARLLNHRAIDLDALVAERERRGPGEIIEQDGEDAFRQVETEALRAVLLDATARVIAVGGGAWTIAENRKLIAAHGGFTVWLAAPFELCWQRMAAAPEPRPLARSREITQKLYTERLPFYELADVRVSVSENDGVGEVAAKVASALLRLEDGSPAK